MRDERHRLFVLLSTALILSLAGCSRTAARRTVRDDLGRAVALPPHVNRVISLAPNVTEMIYAIGSGAKLVATDDFSDEPPAAKRLARVGGMQPSIEKIASLQPDLVIATTNGNHPALAPALGAVRIPLFVVRTDRIDEIPAAMERLSALLGSPRPGAAASLRASLDAQRRKRTHPPRILFAVWADPLYVAGTQTFTDDLLALVGAQNAVQLRGWPQYSVEVLVAHAPELVLYPTRSVSRSQIDALLSKIPAGTSKVRVEGVDENLFTRPGPRVALAAAELNRIVDSWEQSQ